MKDRKQYYFDAVLKTEIDKMVLNPKDYNQENLKKEIEKIDEEINDQIIKLEALKLIHKNKKIEQLRKFIEENPEDKRTQYLTAGSMFRCEIKFGDWKKTVKDILERG